MAGEAPGESDRYRRLAQRPFEGPGYITVASEAHPSAPGVADPQPAAHWIGRPIWLGARRRQLPGTAISGRLRPVGPTWIAVPRPGQTPQS